MSDDTTRYFKDPSKLIYELMQDTLGDKYQYFLGSPISIAERAYPCIVIQPTASDNTIQNAPTGHDAVSEQINIHVLFLETTSAVGQGTQDTVLRRIYNVVEGRDPATGFYMEGTIKYALRTNLELYNPVSQLPTLIDEDFHTDYTVTPQPDKAIIEAIITITTAERIEIPDRIIG